MNSRRFFGEFIGILSMKFPRLVIISNFCPWSSPQCQSGLHQHVLKISFIVFKIKCFCEEFDCSASSNLQLKQTEFHGQNAVDAICRDWFERFEIGDIDFEDKKNSELQTKIEDEEFEAWLN